jgi:hypothetical protein
MARRRRVYESCDLGGTLRLLLRAGSFDFLLGSARGFSKNGQAPEAVPSMVEISGRGDARQIPRSA